MNEPMLYQAMTLVPPPISHSLCDHVRMGNSTKKSEQPEDHRKADQTSEIVLDQFKRADNFSEPVFESPFDRVHVPYLHV